ncbi:hypothetical protein M2347_002730 [Chryseobacterium sp. H1D6B]|uniref:hypothetical protein n=1 Tax=Chryseobacterium sp. H1D6B TaxID=2940588 RepID=UPI0015CAA762|nr:hypothetical protein [Chryseobacterium sp. H1D6B]MDH6253003.1 hypothetical protein [Chryseobacterium sp. H1D6B]
MKKSQLLALLWSFMLISCGSVSMVKSWAKEKYTFGQDPAKKVLIIALTKDETSRRSVEDEMKTKLSDQVPEVLTSYKYVKAGESKDKLTDFIKENNFTHVITIRLASVDTEVEYTPASYTQGDYYSSFPVYYRDYGVYLNRAWESAYQPESFEEHTEYTLETNIYSLKDKGLVYSALTSSFKGSGFDKTIYATISTIKKDMEKAGLFK